MTFKNFKVGQDLLLPFGAGGFVVAGATILSKFLDPKWGALFWSCPFTLIPASIILWYTIKRDKRKTSVSKFLWSSLIGTAALVAFIVGFWGGLKKYEYGPALGIGIASWIGVAIIYSLAVCPSPFKGGKCISMDH